MARVPVDLKKNPQAFAVMKLLGTAINNLSEESAKEIAGHIISFANYIQHQEGVRLNQEAVNCSPLHNEALKKSS